MTCFNQLVLWDPPVNYYSISRRQGSTSNPKHSVSRHWLSGTLYLQLLKVPLPSPLLSNIENWTVLCRIRHGITFLMPPVPPFWTLRHMVPLINVFDIWHLIVSYTRITLDCDPSNLYSWCVILCYISPNLPFCSFSLYHKSDSKSEISVQVWSVYGHWSSIFILLTPISYTPLLLCQERSARGVKMPQ